MNELVKVLRKRYLNLTQEQAEHAAQVIVNDVADRLAAGAAVGSVAVLPNGDLDLSIYLVENMGGDDGDNHG